MKLDAFEIRVESNGSLTAARYTGARPWELSNIQPHINGAEIEYLGFKVLENTDDRLSVEYDTSAGTITIDTVRHDGSTAAVRMKAASLPAGARWKSVGLMFRNKLQVFNAAYRSGQYCWEPSAIHTLGGSALWKSYDVLGLTGDRFLVMGYVSHADHNTRFDYSADDELLTSIVASCETDAIDFSAHGLTEVDCEELIITEQDTLVAGLEHWANITAEKMGARKDHPVVTGWDSWYSEHEHVTHERCLSVLQQIRQRHQELPLDYFMIGLGYSKNLGDWLEPSRAYGASVKETIDAIRQAGMKPGIWIAPFVIGNRSELYQQHPEWVRRWEDGRPMVVSSSRGEPALWYGNEEFYAADVTNDDFLSHMKEIIRTIRKEWGVDLLKVDYCHYATVGDAPYAKEGYTRAQIYRKGMMAIRDAFGDGFLLGNNAPLCKSIGIVDGCRINAELGPQWKGWYNNESAIRTAMLRAFMGRRFWLNDAGPIFARAMFNAMDDQESETCGLVQSMTGDVCLTGDSFRVLSGDRLKLLRRLLPVLRSKKAGAPEHYLRVNLDEAAPGVIVKQRDLKNRTIVAHAVVNLSDNDRIFKIDLSGGVLTGDVHVYDMWQQQYRGRKNGSLSVTLPAHTSELYITSEATDEPSLICSVSHSTGAEDIEVVKHNRSSLQLAPNRSPATALVYSPGPLEAQPKSTIVDYGDGVYEVTIHKQEDNKPTSLQVQKQAVSG